MFASVGVGGAFCPFVSWVFQAADIDDCGVSKRDALEDLWKVDVERVLEGVMLKVEVCCSSGVAPGRG